MSIIYQINKSELNTLKITRIQNAQGIRKLYRSLTKSGYSSCFAIHEAKKLLLLTNPFLSLNELSKITLEITNPLLKHQYENSIDNHSHN